MRDGGSHQIIASVVCNYSDSLEMDIDVRSNTSLDILRLKNSIMFTETQLMGYKQNSFTNI